MKALCLPNGLAIRRHHGMRRASAFDSAELTSVKKSAKAGAPEF